MKQLSEGKIGVFLNNEQPTQVCYIVESYSNQIFYSIWKTKIIFRDE